MSYKLFLDDMRKPVKVYPDTLNTQWVHVHNFDEFVSVLQQKGIPSFISFDHDLAEEHYAPLLPNQVYKEKTGYDCALWLTNYCQRTQKPLPPYKVHSFNPTGKTNIIKHLEQYVR